MTNNLEAESKSIADTRDVVGVQRLLDSIEPCEREAVLGRAVQIFNKEHPNSMPYMLKIENNDLIRKDTLQRSESSFLGLGPNREVPVLIIEVPTECNKK